MKDIRAVIILSFVFILTTSGVVLSTLWKDNQTVKDIEVSGNVTLSRQELFSFARLTDSIIYSGSVTLEMIESRLLKHPSLREVSVSREDNVLKIKVTEKMPFAIVCNGRNIMFIDNNLTLYNYTRNHSNIDLPVINGLSNKTEEGIISRKDLIKLEIAKFIISSSVEISRGLYSLISEIDFSDSSGINLITNDDATLVYFLDYSLIDKSYRNMDQSLPDIKNKQLRQYIYTKLIYLDSFLKQVKLYKPSGTIEYVDIRYDEMIAVKNKN